MPKTRKMLSDWQAPYLQSLRRLIETQSKETLASWDEIGQCAAAECSHIEATLRSMAVEHETNPAKINWNC
ncbi:MAG: hypothetical protein Q7I98_03070 [Erysipelotrichaceae bacterium]|nr:hypothetical protein [Erysipelotrichaceae bacterium]PKM71545.1 MAG: hypothetical protein CVU92_08150 [Firmicutes bacterium HGW-Firmicutes-17]